MSRRTWTFLALTAALWGASYLFIKVALDDGFSEPFIVFARCALGAVVLVPLALRAGAVPLLRARGHWNLTLSLVQVVAPFLLITYGERHVPTGLAGILVASAPLWVAILALRLDAEERSQGAGLVGLVVGMLGVGMLFGVDLSGDRDEVLGGLMVVGAALLYAVAGFIVKRRFTGVPPEGIAASSMVIAAAVTIPFAALQPPDHAPGLDAVASLVVLGAGGTGVAFLFYYGLMRDMGPARASVVAYVAPAFAVLYGVTLLGEQLTVGTVLGLGLILLGSSMAGNGRPPAPLARLARLVSRTGPSRSSVPAPGRAR